MKVIARYYTIEDWSIAKFLINTQNSLDHRICDIKWAERVLLYFKSYIKIAKLYCKHFDIRTWGHAIQVLWRRIKYFAHYNDIHALLKSVRNDVYLYLRQQITTYRRNKDYRSLVNENVGIVIRSRSAKSERRSNVMKKTELTHKLFSQGKSSL